MKTVDEILRPFMAQPDMIVEGHYAVKSNGSKNMLKVEGLNKECVIRAIITCNPELRKEENAALLGEVIARVEQEMQPSVSSIQNTMSL